MPRQLFIALFLLLLLFAARLIIFPPSTKELPYDRNIQFSGVVETTPKLVGNRQSFFLGVENYEDVYITTSSLPPVHYGERLVIRGVVKKDTLDDGRVFISMSYPLVEKSSLQDPFYRLRKAILSKFESFLDPDYARLLLGIVLGMKEPLSEEFYSQIQETGLLHVIAASGMNITLLASGLLVIFGIIFSRRTTAVVTVLTIIFYACLSGLEPSIVRASLMGGVGLIASLMGRQYFGLWILALTGYAMLFLDPTLFSDVGFQLSFLATLGIILLKPLLDLSLPSSLKIVPEDLTTTLSAMVMTIPIILMTFGQFNFISIIANLAILWMVLPLMILGGLAILASFVLTPLMQLFIYLCLPFLWLFKELTSFFSQFHLTIHMHNISIVSICIYYGVVIWVVFVIKGRRKLRDSYDLNPKSEYRNTKQI